MSISPSGMVWGSTDMGWSRSLCLSASADAEAADLARQLAPAMPSASIRDAGDWFKISTKDVEEEAREGREALAASISLIARFLAWTWTSSRYQLS